MVLQYLKLAGLWIGWCALHSAMISAPVLRAVEKIPWTIGRFYRLLFNVISAVTFVAVLVFALSIDKEWVWRWEGTGRVVPFVLFAIALVFFIGGGRHYDFKEFLGLRQIDRREQSRSLAGVGRLETGGMLAITRHPWYTGAIAFIWATDVSVARLISNIILTVYLIVGAHLEERKLLDEFGEEYRMYQNRVPMFLPLGFFRPAKRRR
ncbi:MAG: hypothetical protein JSW50_02775 [Candidatus Latescibacterota bacterium]|nr:MAG: hypothetical protein JSW50_02775 [Candidatus Latescibacterota bacterium]